MKIALFSMPRSGSNHIGVTCAQNLGSRYYCELLTYHLNNIDKKFDLVKEYNQLDEPHVIKYMSHNFLNFDFKEVAWAKFDWVIFTDRKNLADCCASTYVSQITGQWSRKPGEELKEIDNFFIEDNFINDFILQVKLFKQAKEYIKLKAKNFIDINFEDIENNTYLSKLSRVLNKNLSVNDVQNYLIPMQRDFAKICLNYNEVKDLLNREFDERL